MPTYSNTHQHHIYDNQLQQKLVLRFGETIAKRDALVQQFFEESIRTNLHSWKGTWVEVTIPNETIYGKINKTDKEVLYTSTIKKSISDSIKRDPICINSTTFYSLERSVKSIF